MAVGWELDKTAQCGVPTLLTSKLDGRDGWVLAKETAQCGPPVLSTGSFVDDEEDDDAELFILFFCLFDDDDDDDDDFNNDDDEEIDDDDDDDDDDGGLFLDSAEFDLVAFEDDDDDVEFFRFLICTSIFSCFISLVIFWLSSGIILGRVNARLLVLSSTPT